MTAEPRDREPASRLASTPDRLAALVAVYESVLGVGPLGPDGDFFEEGGDSTLAMTLVLEIETALGVVLPMTAPFAAPTPRAMAALIADPTGPAIGEPVLMKPGSALPPLFLLPGATGTALELRDFVARLDTQRSVYGLEGAGLHGEREPFDSIEQMAIYQIAAIRRVQPTGPYLLAGYSVGGLVAYEMARRLTRAGETVSMLGLIDTVYPRRQIPLIVRLHVWARRGRHHLALVRRMRPGTGLGYVARRLGNALKDFRPKPPRLPPVASAFPIGFAVRRASVTASMQYRPQPYAGPVSLFWAETDADFTHLDLAWRHRVRSLTVHPIKGDHMTCLTDDVASAASVFSAALDRTVAAISVSPSRILGSERP